MAGPELSVELHDEVFLRQLAEEIYQRAPHPKSLMPEYEWGQKLRSIAMDLENKRSTIARLTAERDELRAYKDDAAERFVEVVRQRAKAEDERDEAMAEAERLRGVFEKSKRFYMSEGGGLYLRPFEGGKPYSIVRVVEEQEILISSMPPAQPANDGEGV